MGYRVVVASDDAGYEYKEAIKADLEKDPRIDEVIDAGVGADGHTYYPDVAIPAAEIIARGEADRGVFVCGTGMGVAISANKVKGIRASSAHDSFSVERLVKSNNGQILCLGERVIGLQLARRLASEFFDYEFDPESPSEAKVAEIIKYENEN
ncbi:MAG: ribose-5-phosphate isomerase [Arcanobacterium sp.]|nr:ribose-5-phosphate isomerase [Arcanobacterium sp.]